MSAWPTFLPLPTIETSVQNSGQTIRTQMESGRFRQRRRFSRDTHNYGVTWIFDSQEFGIFKSFVQFIIDGGASSFDMMVPSGNNIVNGVDAQELLSCRIIGGSYSASNVSKTYWSVTAQLEVEDPTYRFTKDTFQSELEYLSVDRGEGGELEEAIEALENIGPFDWTYGD